MDQIAAGVLGADSVLPSLELGSRAGTAKLAKRMNHPATRRRTRRQARAPHAAPVSAAAAVAASRPGPALTASAVSLALAVACGTPADAPEDAATPDAGAAAEWFVDRAAESGLDFLHASGMSGRFYQPEISGGGAALLDYDNDGDLDVLLVQGGALGADATAPPAGSGPLRDRLYRNDLEIRADGTRSLRFTDVTDASGIATRGYGQGVASGDIDNDGWPDLYLTGFGRNQMLRNNGDGTFEDVSAASGTGSPDTWGVSAAFFDADGDGWLDLFVGNYLIYTVATHIRCYRDSGQEDYCTPERYPPQRDRFYRNRGDGTFEDATLAAGMADEFGPALGVATADFDGDGRIDLFVANDQQENQLWMNRGDGTFDNRALLAGVAVDAAGVAKADMGVDAGDFDNDGD
ncbi:MAG: VCBS repeat-containing protein, partial [Acidobacteria bacterium]|nr:VCBS repeat-containing protein [Acidobacteriota bacterium]